MSDFARSARISELYNKSLYWTNSKIIDFFEEQLVSVPFPIAFEKYLNGYIVVTPNKINYIQITTGDRFVYQSKNQTAWSALNDLYNSSTTSNFKIEVPLYRSEHDEKEYLEIRTPNKEFGRKFSTIIMHETPTASILKSRLVNWIDDVAECLKIVKPIAVEHGIGLPSGIFNPNNYLQDSLDTRYFTNLESNWTVPITANFSEPAESLFSKFKQRQFNHPIALGDIDTLAERARTLWI